MKRTSMDNPWTVVLLSLILGGYPLIPALMSGQLPGIGHTDLIPAVWSIWAFAQEFPTLGHTDLLAQPTGMGWYPQSLHSAIIALPLQGLFSLELSYTLSLWMARSLTFGLVYKAARAWNYSISGACFGTLAIGLSPLLYGYAYEGIIEGTHVWPLGLWLWMLARKSPIGIAVGFFLTITASWYLAAVACLLLLFVIRQEKAMYSIIGLLVASPFIWSFLSAFPEHSPIAIQIRQAHAISLSWPSPFWLKAQPALFGQSAYISVLLLFLVLQHRRWHSLFLLIPIMLGAALPILSDLPVLSAIRFPYRWQLGTTVLAVMLLRKAFQNPISPFLIVGLAAELILAAPFSPILPSTPLKKSELAKHIDAPVLNLPNLLHRPPGEYNPSKKRAVAIYSAQFEHAQPIMATPGFNGLNAQQSHIPNGFMGLDPHAKIQSEAISSADIQALFQAGIRFILVHRKEWPTENSRRLQNQLEKINHFPFYSTDEHLLYAIEVP